MTARNPRIVVRRARGSSALVATVAVTLGTVAALSLSAGAAMPRGQDPGAVTTTTAIELLPATSVTRAPALPEPEVKEPDAEVKGEQAFSDRDGSPSWVWWLLSLLVIAPLIGFLFGISRRRLAGSDADRAGRKQGQ